MIPKATILKTLHIQVILQTYFLLTEKCSTMPAVLILHGTMLLKPCILELCHCFDQISVTTEPRKSEAMVLICMNFS